MVIKVTTTIMGDRIIEMKCSFCIVLDDLYLDEKSMPVRLSINIKRIVTAIIM
jgi:hypothetical protein